MRHIFRLTVALAALLAANSLRAAELSDQLGIQTWTLRNLKFEQVVEFAKKHGIKNLQMIGNHMDPKAPVEETKRKKAILDAAGLRVYTFGVAGTSLDKEDNRKLFEFAKLMGIQVIVVEPGDFKILDNLEELVKEYDIKLAIHNHNLDTVYGSPEKVKKVLNARDRRIGVCMDVGWITAAGFDAAEAFRGYDGRVYDMHFKDKVVETAADGKKVPVDTEIGQGKANYQGLFAAIKQSKWTGVLAIETDSKAFAEDPNKLVAGAKAFFASQVK
jgi:sugar phosphate isomerase/epimerase